MKVVPDGRGAGITPCDGLHGHWTRNDLMRLEPEDIFTDSPELLLEQFQS